MNVIEVKHLTKDYGHGRGIYDVSFAVKKGEVFGFLGPNGAGKSTTMRHLMGFSKPQKGQAVILNQSCWKQHESVMKTLGYLPGEVTLPEGLNATQFVEMMKKLKGVINNKKIDEIIKEFEINLNGNIKKMSIGEKRKLAILAAFMNSPDVLLLDEPTSGLDPVMQEKFIEYIKKEKDEGKTILLSSHIFSEVEALCDRIAIIKEGKIISVVNAEDVKHYKRKTFEIIFKTDKDFKEFTSKDFDIRETAPEQRRVSVGVENSGTNEFVRELSQYSVASLIQHQQTLEDYFMHFYKTDRSFEGITKKRGDLSGKHHKG